MKSKKTVKKNILLKVALPQKIAMKRLANRYTNGNVCQWLRFAATNYHPTRSELKKLG